MTDLKVLPDESAITKATTLEVLDVNGDKVVFGSIFEEQKTVVVFIRHFFCGICQAYVEHLAKVPQESLAQAATKIVIIGCGDALAIKTYTETTKFAGPIYADPSRELYRALGMTIETLQRTPAGEERRSYLGSMSTLGNALRSIWRGPLKNPTLIGKQGNFSQLGGEFVFGPGKTCSFASRMKHTEDHIEVADLMNEAGVVFS